MSTPPVPAPSIALASDFPAPSDRSAGTFNAKAVDWANSARTMASNMHAAAVATATNATSAQENAQSASAAELAANQSAAAADQSASTAGGYASTAQAARNQAVKLNLGAHASAPTTDIDGHPILTGATYFDITLDKWRVWTGTGWVAGVSAIAGVSSFGGLDGDIKLTDVLPAFTGKARYVLAVNPQAAGVEFVPGMQSGYEEFTSSSVWPKPADATFIYVEAISGGWGGDSGVAAANPNASAPDQKGGGHGSAGRGKLFRAKDLPALCDVVVGAGGLGGKTNNNRAFVAYDANGATSFYQYVASVKGKPGGRSYFVSPDILSSETFAISYTETANTQRYPSDGGGAKSTNTSISSGEAGFTDVPSKAPAAGGIDSAAFTIVNGTTMRPSAGDGEDGADFCGGAAGGNARGGDLGSGRTNTYIYVTGGRGGNGGIGSGGGSGGHAVVKAAISGATHNNKSSRVEALAGDGGDGGHGIVRIWYW